MENHTLLMVAGAGDCGNNPHCKLYRVSDLVYDEAANTANLRAKTGPWEDLLHSYEFHVGRILMSDVIRLEQRD